MDVYRMMFGVDEKRDQQKKIFLKGIDKWLLVDWFVGKKNHWFIQCYYYLSWFFFFFYLCRCQGLVELGVWRIVDGLENSYLIILVICLFDLIYISFFVIEVFIYWQSNQQKWLLVQEFFFILLISKQLVTMIWHGYRDF